MADFQFKNVSLDASGDPLRAHFTWRGELDSTVHTQFAIWIKSHPNVDQNALLAVHVGPTSERYERPFRFDFVTKERAEGGSVVALDQGSLVVEFPRTLLKGYGPTATWWALASLGLQDGPPNEVGDDLDVYSAPDSDQLDLSAWWI